MVSPLREVRRAGGHARVRPRPRFLRRGPRGWEAPPNPPPRAPSLLSNAYVAQRSGAWEKRAGASTAGERPRGEGWQREKSPGGSLSLDFGCSNSRPLLSRSQRTGQEVRVWQPDQEKKYFTCRIVHSDQGWKRLHNPPLLPVFRLRVLHSKMAPKIQTRTEIRYKCAQCFLGTTNLKKMRRLSPPSSGGLRACANCWRDPGGRGRFLLSE